MAFVALMELELAHRGVFPTIAESKDAWVDERGRASRLSEKALVLVGASRMQLDADLDVLRRRTGLEPVQLAIDGTSFVPILEGLFADPSFRGAIIVDYADHVLARAHATAVAQAYERAYEARGFAWRLPDFRTTEGWLAGRWRKRFRSYADGSQPLTALLVRIILRAAPQYIATLPDRSRLADYTKVDARLIRARTLQRLRESGVELPAAAASLQPDEIYEAIARVRPELASLARFEEETRRLAEAAQDFRRRGGKVYFAVLPRSGFVKAIEERRFPRALFWDRFAAHIEAPTLHFEDVPAMRAFVCPDGSHLDYRQREAFTIALIQALALEEQRWRTTRKP